VLLSQAVLSVVESEKDVQAVYRQFTFAPPAKENDQKLNDNGNEETADASDSDDGNSKSGSKACEVDVVARNGHAWIKVKAVSAKNADRMCKSGESRYGERTFLRFAKDLVLCAQQHPVNYQAPIVVLYFVNGVAEPIADQLRALGIQVKGPPVKAEPVLDSDSKSSSSVSSQSTQNLTAKQRKKKKQREAKRKQAAVTLTSESNSGEVKRDMSGDKMQSLSLVSQEFVYANQNPYVNLDVTALFALVSDLTNGYPSTVFTENVLAMMGEDEQVSPAKAMIEKYLEGKDLFICQTAYDKFDEIVQTIGGPEEKKRSAAFLKKVKIMPDNPSERSLKLPTGPKIKDTNRIIFGTGETLKATTLTANVSFIRAARERGVEFSVQLHPSRALTERRRIGTFVDKRH